VRKQKVAVRSNMDGTATFTWGMSLVWEAKSVKKHLLGIEDGVFISAIKEEYR
jgi:hypothetical protein